MKKAILISSLILMNAIVFGQKNWVKQKLTNRFTASFPIAPVKTAGTTFALKDTATHTIFTATYSYIAQNLKIEEKAFAKLVTTNEFASEFLGSLQATLSQYELNEIKIKQEKNYVSYFTEGRSATENKSVFLHIIFLDGIYYSLSCILPDDVDAKSKNTFLSSFQIKK